MDIKQIKILEHITLKSDLDLLSFGEKFQDAFTFPAMKRDYENETEWLDIEHDGIGYNISRPYEEGTLQDWDDTTPEGCNFGITLSFHRDHPHVLDNSWVNNLVANVCVQLTITFNTPVYHHRTSTFGS